MLQVGPPDRQETLQQQYLEHGLVERIVSIRPEHALIAVKKIRQQTAAILLAAKPAPITPAGCLGFIRKPAPSPKRRPAPFPPGRPAQRAMPSRRSWVNCAFGRDYTGNGRADEPRRWINTLSSRVVLHRQAAGENHHRYLQVSGRLQAVLCIDIFTILPAQWRAGAGRFRKFGASRWKDHPHERSFRRERPLPR